MASIDRLIKNYFKNTLKLFIKLAQNSVFSFEAGKHQLSLPEDWLLPHTAYKKEGRVRSPISAIKKELSKGFMFPVTKYATV